jgi:DNA-binding CsgD family transcriptional regulator
MQRREDDEAEILALIHKSRIAVWMRDFEGWAECFVHESYLVRMGWWSHGGVFNRRGWADIAERQRSALATSPIRRPRLAFDARIENLTVRISGDMAWATFDQVYPGGESADQDVGLCHELRVFERHHGHWKIAVLTVIDGGTGQALIPRIRLDSEGRVIWMSAAAKTALAQDTDLQIRGGKLKVRHNRTDAKLRSAIRWAAGVDKNYMSSHGALPILMERGEGLSPKVWWIEADAGLIHFSFETADLVQRQIEAAAIIFCLSSSQARVAAFVAEGFTLNEIAVRMGISTNTARTHLRRIFEKTGVRTQPSLVRLLLSVTWPIRLAASGRPPRHPFG